MLDYNEIASTYTHHRRLHPEVLRALVGSVGPASRVLEVGCGTGNYLVALHQAVGCPCCGIDPSEQMLARARERSDQVEWQSGRAEALEFLPESFDLVFSVDVIHHVEDVERYFQEARRVLAPGGRLCTVTDSADIIRRREPLALYFPDTVAIDLRRYPGTADLAETMRQVGFGSVTQEPVEIRYHLTDLQPYRERAFSCLRLIPEEAFQAGLQRMEDDLQKGPIPGVSRYELVWGTKA